jgi:hypothetical protein
MKVNTTTKYGGSAKENRDGFKLDLTADLSDEQIREAAAIGLASIAYRAGANVINKALEVDSNSGAEFSDDAAERIQSALTNWAASDESPLKGGFDLAVNASRHVHGATQDVKMTDERNAYARHGKAGDLPAFAKTVGYDGAVGDGVAENAPVEFLRAIRRYVNEQLKTL